MLVLRDEVRWYRWRVPFLHRHAASCSGGGRDPHDFFSSVEFEDQLEIRKRCFSRDGNHLSLSNNVSQWPVHVEDEDDVPLECAAMGGVRVV